MRALLTEKLLQCTLIQTPGSSQRPVAMSLRVNRYSTTRLPILQVYSHYRYVKLPTTGSSESKHSLISQQVILNMTVSLDLNDT